MRCIRLSVVFLVLALGAITPVEAGRRPAPGLLLTPQAVVPGPGDATASASFTWKTGRDGFCFHVSLTQHEGYVQTITLHRGAAGVRGTQVLRLSPSPIGINQALGCIPADRALLREISGNPERFYVQVSTTSHPNGAMRGQLRQ